MDLPDPEELASLLATLKNAKVAAFRSGELEISFEVPPPPGIAGFSAPHRQRDEEEQPDPRAKRFPGYHAAFGGQMPSLRKEKGDE